MKKIIAISFIVAFFIEGCQKKQDNIASISSIDRSIDSIMGLMTLEEKIGQLVLYTSTSNVTGPTLDKNYLQYLKKGHIGAIFNAVGANFTKKLQRIAVEETRLGIPLLFGYDAIHGYKTIFPIPLGESCSWDLELMEQTTRVTAIEASASGLHWTYAPMVDIARDPRWGRISEGAGEDSYLGSKIAVARVKGFQGAYLMANNTILACAKHYVAYGAAQSGRDYHSVDISQNTLYNTYLPPFKAALDAGVATFMTSFSEVNGTPPTGSKFLLQDILRKQWGFQGFVVTDYTSINEMVHHGYASGLQHAGELAMNAGVDMDMQGGVYRKYMKKSIEDGKITIRRLNEAVRYILKMKFKLGLFKDPYKYCDESLEKKVVLNENHLKIARDAARKSIVLLKNKGGVLPLKKSHRVALIGPLAADEFHIIGNWAGRGDRNGVAVSVKEGFDAKKVNFTYAKGCAIKDPTTSPHFSPAVQKAKNADVVVLALGESESMSGEAASRSNIKLPENQRKLITAIKKTGKPIVLVLMNGRPLDLSWEHAQVDAIVEAWFPGTSGGHGVTDILFGDFNPCGKLTVTFPRNVGQIPLFYDHKNTGRPSDIEGADQRYSSKYIDIDNTPLYPFGYGLSYTTFKYGRLKMNSSVMTPQSAIKIEIAVSNTGDFDGYEVVQLYLKDPVASITRPVKQLKGFKKIYLKKGETKVVQFTITPEDIAFYKAGEGFVKEEGIYKLFIAGSSDSKFTHEFSFEKSKE